MCNQKLTWAPCCSPACHQQKSGFPIKGKTMHVQRVWLRSAGAHRGDLEKLPLSVKLSEPAARCARAGEAAARPTSSFASAAL